MCARLNPIQIFTVNVKIVGCDRSGYLSLHLFTDAQRWRRFFKQVQTGMSSNFVKTASWKGEWNRVNLSLAQIVISSLWSQASLWWNSKHLASEREALQWVCVFYFPLNQSKLCCKSCCQRRLTELAKAIYRRLQSNHHISAPAPRAPSKCNMPLRSWHPGALHHVFSIVYEIRDCTM